MLRSSRLNFTIWPYSVKEIKIIFSKNVLFIMLDVNNSKSQKRLWIVQHTKMTNVWKKRHGQQREKTGCLSQPSKSDCEAGRARTRTRQMIQTQVGRHTEIFWRHEIHSALYWMPNTQMFKINKKGVKKSSKGQHLNQWTQWEWVKGGTALLADTVSVSICKYVLLFNCK